MTIKEDLEKYLEAYECKCEYGEQPWGCFDCQNMGVIPDSEESGLIFYALRRIYELEDKARDGEDLVKRLDAVCLLLGDFPAKKQSIETQIGEYIKRWGK